MAQEFACKEDGCTKKVVYERQTDDGIGEAAAKDFDAIGEGSKRVYLECELGHVHPYLVST